jgi:hypothetical protein
MIREPGEPCWRCQAAGKCKHSEPAPLRRLREALPDSGPPGPKRDSTGNGYNFHRASPRYAFRHAKRNRPG